MRKEQSEVVKQRLCCESPVYEYEYEPMNSPDNRIDHTCKCYESTAVLLAICWCSNLDNTRQYQELCENRTQTR